MVMSSLSDINFYKRRLEELRSALFSDEIMITIHRDHTVCGICNVSFYVARRFKESDGKVYTTTPGNKVTGAAYDEANISHDEMKISCWVQVLVKKPSAQVIHMVDRYPFFESRSQDGEYFLTYRFPICPPPYGTTCFANIPLVPRPGGTRCGIRKIKMCSHEDGPCAEAFDSQNPTHAVVVPFHGLCLEILQNVSLYKKDKIVWQGLYELGIQKNHTGFNGIERDPTSEISHQHNDDTREIWWRHTSGTEWMVLNPFSCSIHDSVGLYTPPATGVDPREQVYFRAYRLGVCSIGPGAWKYWGPRVRSLKLNISLKNKPCLTGIQRNIGFVVKKPRLATLPAPTNYAAVNPRPSIAPLNTTQVVSGPSDLATTLSSSLTPPHTGRDLFSTLDVGLRLLIFDYLDPSPSPPCAWSPAASRPSPTRTCSTASSLTCPGRGRPSTTMAGSSILPWVWLEDRLQGYVLVGEEGGAARGRIVEGDAESQEDLEVL
jgi:hypothetical protein